MPNPDNKNTDAAETKQAPTSTSDAPSAKKSDTVSAPTKEADHSFELSLEEFCTRLSASVKAPELIASFHHVEKKAGVIKDKSENFMARFEAHKTKPVK